MAARFFLIFGKVCVKIEVEIGASDSRGRRAIMVDLVKIS